MKKKSLIILFFVSIIANSIFSENNYYLVSFYKAYGKEETYTKEFKFYDDGLIKQITLYDIRKECDYYNWENIKKNSNVIRQYKIKREEKKIEVILNENGSEKIVSTLTNINNNEWLVDNQKQYNTSQSKINFVDGKHDITNETILVPGVKAYLVDNNLYRLISHGIGYGGKEYIEEQKVSFDGNKIYRVATNHDYGEECFTINYISDFIPFTKEAALLNQCIGEFFILEEVFYTVPTIPPKEVLYKDSENNLKTVLWNQDVKSITISSNTIKFNLIDNKFGLELYTDNKNTPVLLLKSEKFALMYDNEESIPFFKGFSDKKQILMIDKIESSSALKEGKIEYSAENLKSLKLKHPWVEGVKGDGIGEYIQFNKKDASGLFILNGFISLDRFDLYEKNNRIEKITISGMTSNAEKEVLLLDTAKPQYIDLSDFSNNEEIKLEIQSVYKGTKYDDTCITGIILIR